jgi:hypothetical protein
LKIPRQLGLDEGRDECSTGAVDVNRNVQAGSLLQAIEGRTQGADILVLGGRGGLHIRDILVPLERHRSLLNIPVAQEFVPADLRVDASLRIFSRQRHFSASPPGRQASLDPIVDVPKVLAGSGECHKSARMWTQRIASPAVCGYLSLSMWKMKTIGSTDLRRNNTERWIWGQLNGGGNSGSLSGSQSSIPGMAPFDNDPGVRRDATLIVWRKLYRKSRLRFRCIDPADFWRS